MAKGFTGALAASALLMSSTAVAAGNAASPQQISPWAALTVLSGAAPAAAVCGAGAVTVAQPAPTGCVLPVTDAPPPPPQASAPPPAVPLPAEMAATGYGMSPLLASLAAVALGVGLFFLVKGHHHGHEQPNSPA